MNARSGRTAHGIDIVPSGGPLGAEVRGMDLRHGLDDADLAAVREALAEHLVLEWRGQTLSVDQHLALGRRLGDLEDMTHVAAANGLPTEILVIENDPAKNRPDAPPEYLRGFQNKYVQWHSDQSYRAVPPMGSLFYMREGPAEGGVTQFINMYAAYDALSDDLKNRIAGRMAIHDPSLNSANVLREGAEPPADVSQGRGVRHPLVRRHPVTGRPALYLGRRPYAYICGYAVPESEALLDALWAHATNPRFVWARRDNPVGTVLLWDNRCTMHARTALESDAPRLAHRVQIAGEPPVMA